MSFFSKIKEMLGGGDSINVHVSREEFEAYRREQDEIHRAHMKAEEDNDSKLMAEMKAKAAEAIRQRVLHEGPPLMRRLWWKISDALAFLPAALIVIEKLVYGIFWGGSFLFFVYNVATFINFASTTGLAAHTFFILFPLVAITAICSFAMTAYYFNETRFQPLSHDSIYRLIGVLGQFAFVGIFYICTSVVALAPSGNYVAVVRDAKGALTVEDYKNTTWIDHPLEHAKRVEKYYYRDGSFSNWVAAVVRTKIAGKDIKVNSSIKYDWPNSSKFLDLYKSGGSVEGEVKVMQDKFLKIFGESLPVNNMKLNEKLKTIDDAMRAVGSTDFAQKHFEEAQEKIIESAMENALVKRLAELGDGLIEPQSGSLSVSVTLVRPND